MTQAPVTTTLFMQSSSSGFYLNPPPLASAPNWNTAGGGNFFPFIRSFPLTPATALSGLYRVLSVFFKAEVDVNNAGAPASGYASPAAVACAASLTTDGNGVVAAVNPMTLANYSQTTVGGTGLFSIYDFQGTLNLPVPMDVDLLGNPTLNIVAGIALPLPIVPSTGAAGSSPANPYVTNYSSTAGPGVTTSVAVSGYPWQGGAP